MKTILIISIIILTGCSGFLKDMGYQKNPRPWTTEEKIIAGASILATFADWKTTTDLIDRGGYEALNPTTGRHPSDERLGITLGIFEGFCIWLAHKFPYLRKWGLGGKTVLNTGLAVHNSKE